MALENHNHSTGVELIVEGDFNASCVVEWAPISLKHGWREPREVAENGSIAIAFLLILELTEYQIVQQAVIGIGFDYWLGYKDDHQQYDPDNFLNARLEVSGMNKGNRTQMNRRALQKLNQIQISDYLKIPAYIIVTEFGTPVSLIIEK